jgi:hypothetical protein
MRKDQGPQDERVSRIYKNIEVDAEFEAPKFGFVIVRLFAKVPKRDVTASVLVNGETVASASAADNFVENVISSMTQSMTVPVPGGATIIVKRESGDATIEARWISI